MPIYFCNTRPRLSALQKNHHCSSPPDGIERETLGDLQPVISLTSQTCPLNYKDILAVDKTRVRCRGVLCKVRISGLSRPLFFFLSVQNEMRPSAARGGWIFLPPVVQNISSIENNYLQKAIWIQPETRAIWWDTDPHGDITLCCCSDFSLFTAENTLMESVMSCVCLCECVFSGLWIFYHLP